MMKEEKECVQRLLYCSACRWLHCHQQREEKYWTREKLLSLKGFITHTFQRYFSCSYIPLLWSYIPLYSRKRQYRTAIEFYENEYNFVAVQRCSVGVLALSIFFIRLLLTNGSKRNNIIMFEPQARHLQLFLQHPLKPTLWLMFEYIYNTYYYTLWKWKIRIY